MAIPRGCHEIVSSFTSFTPRNDANSMIKKIFLIIVIVIVIFYGYRALFKQPEGVSENIEWDIGFSKPFATDMGLDWKETYLAILNEMQPHYLRLPVYWQDIEPEQEKYFFEDYDWMVSEAGKRGVKLVLVVGRKLPRWPECHVPDWAKFLEEKNQQEKALDVLAEIVKRYKDSSYVYAWQVENEPFLAFGECPDLDAKFLDKEIALVRSLGGSRSIIVTDSGELSIWIRAAKRADIFGTTMYRTVYSKHTGYFEYPLPPKFFWLKANFTRLFYPGKPIIVSELQAEPWGPKLIYELPYEELERSMTIEKFRDNIEYARKVGFSPVFLWGSEWWYWMKVKYNQPEYWEEAKTLINIQ